MSDLPGVRDENDDLPVLTQVLRVGSGAAGVGPLRAPGDAPADAVTESSIDEMLLGDQLVIGTEPHVGLEPYIPLTTPLSDAGTADGESLSRSPAAALIVPFVEPLGTPAHSHGDPVVASGEGAAMATSIPAPLDADALAVRVRESVLSDLAARIDTEFDARIAQTLRAEVEAALASLQANLREQLADAVRDVVRRAVEDQMTRLHDHTRGEPGRG